MRHLLLVAVVLLTLIASGCAAMAPDPYEWTGCHHAPLPAKFVAGNPELHCGAPADPFDRHPRGLACAVRDYPANMCWIVVRPGDTLSQVDREHELKHCGDPKRGIEGCDHRPPLSQPSISWHR